MEENKKSVDEQLMSLLKSDGLGQVPDSVPSPNDVLLPKPISDKIQKEIVEQNFVRRLFPNIMIPRSARDITIPALTYDSLNVHVVTYGTDVTTKSEDTFSTAAVVLTPKLFVAWTDMIEDDIETAGVDLARTVREVLTSQIAQAEERVELYGNTAGATSTYLDAINGVYTIANGVTCATSPVTFGSSDDRQLKVMEARQALGIYGNDVGNLVLLCSTTFGLALRQTQSVYSNQYRISSDLLETGTMPPISGIKVIETSYLDGKGDIAVLVRKDAFIIGVRKGVHFRTDDIVEKFSKRIIIAEEVDMQPQMLNGSSTYEGMVLVEAS